MLLEINNLPKNSIIITNPELIKEWHEEKNTSLGFDIESITKGSKKVVWWVCPNCESPYDMMVKNRTNGQNCPYCSGKRVNHTNSLASLRPEIAREWHSSKNGNLTPRDFVCGCGDEFWWECDRGHEWKVSIAIRTHKNTGCPKCSGRDIIQGETDMWTTNPELASMLLNPDEGYKYTQYSNQKVDWKCPDCNTTIKNKTIANVKRQSLFCSKCSDGKSYPERFVTNLLSLAKVEFEREVTFLWSENRRYDFYIPSMNLLIEVHGEQHYSDTEWKVSLDEQIEIDKRKKQLALANLKNTNYIEIEARESEKLYLFEKVNKSLGGYICFDGIDIEEAHRKALEKPVFIASELWTQGYKLSEIEEKMMVGSSALRKYLCLAKDLGLCNYSTKEAVKRSKVKKPIIQFSLKGDFIKEWESISDAGKTLNLDSSAISKCVREKLRSTGGFKWKEKTLKGEN